MSEDAAHSSAGSRDDVNDEETRPKPPGSKRDAAQPSQDFEFPYRLANEWVVWYNSAQKKSASSKEFVASFQQMKHVFEFDSVKSFWGLYNHIDFKKMPVGANLRIFKKPIQPTWEDPRNVNGGTWHLVPRLYGGQRDPPPAILVYKELLLAMIAGDLGPLINGIVLSVKSQDTIISLWCESNRSKKYNKVKSVAMQILHHYCTPLIEGSDGGGASVDTRLEWTWRAHPNARAEDPTRKKKKGQGELLREVSGENRGACGECLGGQRFNACTVQ